MQIHRATVETCGQATGLVVSIDVLRAFTTAAYLFAAGVPRITLVAGVEEAFELRRQDAGRILVGEENGLIIPGFDFNNSPSAFIGRDLRGVNAVLRTSAGTQGVVKAVRASARMGASLVCAGATVRHIQHSGADDLTLVETGRNEPGWGDEDAACADLIEAGLRGLPVDQAEIVRRVRKSIDARRFAGHRSDSPPIDLDLAVEIDRFPFAIVVTPQDGLLVASAVPAA